MVVLVTGASGQLGQAIQSIEKNYPFINFVFCSFSKLDITNKENCEVIFEKYKPDFCINTAAFTAVDNAELEPERAYRINVIGSKNIAEICKKCNAVLVHISTDFVFDGNKNIPYTELDCPNPIGIYGKTKLEGEITIQKEWEKYFIVRTSWVYSPFGHNFMKTMLRLAVERDSLTVVNDQIGTPTSAIDLAEVLVKIITSNFQLPTSNLFGIYNFSNEGQCSWYDFAKKIVEINNISTDLHPIPTSSYPTPAKRPAYSVLDKSKIKNTFEIEIKSWEESLKKLIFKTE